MRVASWPQSLSTFSRWFCGRDCGRTTRFQLDLCWYLCWGIFASACSASGTTGSDPPGSHLRNQKISLIQRSFRPKSDPVEGYGWSEKHSLGEFEQAILKAVEKLPVSHEPSLSALTRDLAVAMEDSYAAAPGLVEGLLAWHGRSSPPPQFLITGIDGKTAPCKDPRQDDCKALIQAVAEEARQVVGKRKSMIVGVGVGGDKPGVTRIVVALLEQVAHIAPISKRMDPQKATVLRTELAPGFTHPRLEIIDPNGVWSNLEPQKNKKEFVADLNCFSGRGTYQIELLADGQYGPEVVANFPLYCGADPPSRIEYTLEQLSEDISVAELEQENFRFLNEARAVRGLEPLLWASDATKIARSHSRDMALNNFVGHRSETTGEVAQRFARTKLKAAVIRENVARGYGPYSIHESLIASPGHRANIFAEDITHVGIGIVVGKSRRKGVALARPLFLTQNFYSKLDVKGPKNLRKALRVAANRFRKRLGQRPIQWDEKIASIAQQYAKQLARNQNRVSLEQVQSLVFSLGYGQVDFHKVQAGSWQSLENLELWAKLKGGDTGVGIERINSGDDVGFVVIAIEARDLGTRQM